MLLLQPTTYITSFSILIFFLALGASLNPVQLQTYFEYQAENLLVYFQNHNHPDFANYEEAWLNDPCSSVLTENSLIDSLVLMQIWPKELDNFRVGILTNNSVGQSTSLCIYTPSNSIHTQQNGAWDGKDIIIQLQHSHFQLLNLGNVKKCKPIDALLSWATKNEIHIQKLFIASRESIQIILQRFVVM